ncbi:MAG: L,D-transpeptidase family protein [Lachnospiraceae bacterium]|nr:L,D-transpeptidase family protein [Lachnospiraceae bacterium]
MKILKTILLTAIAVVAFSVMSFAAGPGETRPGCPGVKQTKNSNPSNLHAIAESAGLKAGTNMTKDPILGMDHQVAYTFYLNENTALPAISSAGNEYLFSEEGFPRFYMDHDGVGRYYYRVYTNTDGWSPWCNSKEITPVSTDAARVQAIQIRQKGYTATLGDIYYKSVLNDGTVLDWAEAGQTSGTVGTDKYIVAFAITKTKRGSGAPGSTYAPMAGRNYEGPFVDQETGKVGYSTFDRQPYTGWAWLNNKQYYFHEGNLCTGWIYADGYKYFCGEDGAIATDLEPVMGLVGNYHVKYNKATRTLYVMAYDQDSKTYCIPYKTFMSSCGPDTPLGTFKTYAKYDWKYMHDSEDGAGAIYCQKLTRFKDGFLMHSLLYYDSPSPFTLDAINYNFIDDAASGGCIRLRAGDANWIYNNIPNNTPVIIYENLHEKGPIEKDCIEQAIPRNQKYDPTDPEALADIAAGNVKQTAEDLAAAQAAIERAAKDDASMGITTTE